MTANTAHEIKSRVWADPSRSPKDIFEELTGAGVKCTIATVSTYRADFLNSVAVLRELGALPPAPAAEPVAEPVAKPAKPKRRPKAEAAEVTAPEAELAPT